MQARLRLVTSSISVVLAALLLLPAAAGAQTVTTLTSNATLPPSPWRTPVRVSGQTVAAWWPTIAADDSGTVDIVWNGSFSDGPKWDATSSTGAAPADVPSLGTADRVTHTVAGLFYARGDADGWTQPNDIALVWAGHALRSALAADPVDGRLHLLYKGMGELVPNKLDPPRSLGPEDIWYTSSPQDTADSVHSWSQARRLSRATEAYFSDMAIDRHGVIHAIWTESDSGTWLIYYSHSRDGGATWSNRIALQDTGLVWWYRAHLVVDAQDRVHVTWETTDQQHLASTRQANYAESTDGGGTWTTTSFKGTPDPVHPNQLGPGPQQPAVGVDGQGQLLIVTREPVSNRIQYITSMDGVTWSSALPLPGVREGVARPYDGYDMATDSAGHVHVAMVGYLEGSNTMALLHSVWDGQSWSRPDVITGSPLYPEYPKLAISGGNRLHVSWFVGDKPGIERSPLGVWYSTRMVEAPVTAHTDWVPVPALPTAVPTPTSRRDTDDTPRPLAIRPGPDAPVGAPVSFASVRQQAGFPLFAAVAPIAIMLGLGIVLKLKTLNRHV